MRLRVLRRVTPAGTVHGPDPDSHDARSLLHAVPAVLMGEEAVTVAGRLLIPNHNRQLLSIASLEPEGVVDVTLPVPPGTTSRPYFLDLLEVDGEAWLLVVYGAQPGTRIVEVHRSGDGVTWRRWCRFRSDKPVTCFAHHAGRVYFGVGSEWRPVGLERLELDAAAVESR